VLSSDVLATCVVAAWLTVDGMACTLRLDTAIEARGNDDDTVSKREDLFDMVERMSSAVILACACATSVAAVGAPMIVLAAAMCARRKMPPMLSKLSQAARSETRRNGGVMEERVFRTYAGWRSKATVMVVVVVAADVASAEAMTMTAEEAENPLADLPLNEISPASGTVTVSSWMTSSVSGTVTVAASKATLASGDTVVALTVTPPPTPIVDTVTINDWQETSKDAETKLRDVGICVREAKIL